MACDLRPEVANWQLWPRWTGWKFRMEPLGRSAPTAPYRQLPTILDARYRMQLNFSQQIWSSECQSSCNNEKQDFFATWCLSSCKDLNVPSEGTLKRKSKGRRFTRRGFTRKVQPIEILKETWDILRHPETLWSSLCIGSADGFWGSLFWNQHFLHSFKVLWIEQPQWCHVRQIIDK